MAVTWITPVEVTPGTADSWIDVDVSASVPAGATGVILHIVNTAAATGYRLNVRKNGSTDNRLTWNGGVTDGIHFWQAIGVDSNRVFEAFVDVTDSIDIYLVGYFTSDAVFFTNAVDKSLTTTGAWTDIDISADTGADTAIGAIFEAVAGNQSMGLRKNGSTDARTNWFSLSHTGVIIGVDGSEICEGYIGNASTDFFLAGYIISGSTLLTNATNLSLGSAGVWTDLAALPAGATGGFIEVATGGGTVYQYGLRKNGNAEDIYQEARFHKWGFVECDASQIIEGKIENTVVDFFLVGYSEAGEVTGFMTPNKYWGA